MDYIEGSTHLDHVHSPTLKKYYEYSGLRLEAPVHPQCNVHEDGSGE